MKLDEFAASITDDTLAACYDEIVVMRGLAPLDTSRIKGANLKALTQEINDVFCSFMFENLGVIWPDTRYTTEDTIKVVLGEMARRYRERPNAKETIREPERKKLYAYPHKTVTWKCKRCRKEFAVLYSEDGFRFQGQACSCDEDNYEPMGPTFAQWKKGRERYKKSMATLIWHGIQPSDAHAVLRELEITVDANDM